MSDATWVVGSFLGGEISQFAQGRFDKPDYRISLKTCLNWLPAEIGTLVRRPGTAHGGITRGGAPGRVVKFDFEQSNAITLEFTDGFLRFRNGPSLIYSSTPVAVVAVSAANPAVVQLGTAVTWVTGDTLVFPGASTPLLENRQFVATKVDTTHFALADALSGANIDGATLGALAASATVAKVHERVTPYAGGSWATIRAVQAETTDILLCGTVAPQALQVTTLPSPGISPGFSLGSATFNDGPYLDPFTNGVIATPSAVSGVIGITLAFQTYSATVAYRVGDFVTSSSINYVSLIDQNQANTPASVPTAWAVTSVIAAINGGRGFLGTDIGRLARFFSGTVWTWGKITSISTIIDRALAGSANIGTMTAGGGIAAAFDGVFSQAAAASAEQTVAGGAIAAGTVLTMSSYVGKNYTGAADQKIQQATVYPSSDLGFAGGTYHIPAFFGNGTHAPPTIPAATYAFIMGVTFNLRGKASAPASSADGTLLGTSGGMGNTFSPVTIVSTDQVTAWKYVWVEQVSSTQVGGSLATDFYSFNNVISELSLFNPPGSGISSGFNIEILGGVLPSTSAITLWRLGVYSDTTGWPTCGCYHEGRLWLGGSVANRFDASVSNGIVGGTINFAPTDATGAVAGSNAISYVLNSDSVNPIFWMQPDLQGLLMGTQAGEWLAVAPTTGPLSPSNIAARRVTKIGCANVEPRRTEHTILFVKRYGRKLMEYFADVYSGKFSAPNIADKAQHIPRTGILELAYTEAVTPIAWGRCTDGSLFGVTYKRDTLTTSQGPTFAGFHRHALGSGRIVESICSGPSVGGDLDSLTMVTNNPASNIRHVEVLTDTPDELTALAASWFLDDAVNPTSTSTTNNASIGAPYGGLTINGLWHLNGATVQVFAGGLDCGDPGEGKPFADFVVNNGSVTVPYADSLTAGPGRGLFTAAFAAGLPLTQIVVGFTYTSDGQLVRPILQADSGARNGPAFGKLTRAHRYAMKLVNTLGLSIGGTFAKLRPANFKQPANTALPPLTLFNGISQEALNDDDDYDNGVCFRVSRPFPANLVAIGLNLNTKDQ
jgi:hypothetical protein